MGQLLLTESQRCHDVAETILGDGRIECLALLFSVWICSSSKIGILNLFTYFKIVEILVASFFWPERGGGRRARTP